MRSYRGGTTGTVAGTQSAGAQSPGAQITLNRDRRVNRLSVVLAINVLVVVGQAVAGVAAHSLGLLADAGHNLTDVAALLMALLAVRLARRPPTATRSYGYHRSTVLAAQANAAGLLVATAVISIESVRRLIYPSPVRGGLVLAVALGALAFNAFGALLLVERGGRDLNMRAALLHMVADAGSSAGVALAGAVMVLTGGAAWLDPAMALAVAAVIAVQASLLVRQANAVLLESTPAGLDPRELQATMAAVHGVEDIHDLHAWSLSSEVRALSAHVVLTGHPTLEQAQVVGEEVKAAITRFGIVHATLELECEACVCGDGPPCSIDTTDGSLRTAAAAIPGHRH
jgi:cobalt-zinc-cadmium efflux system protein